MKSGSGMGVLQRKIAAGDTKGPLAVNGTPTEQAERMREHGVIQPRGD
jgi:hypothetical protein